MSTALDQNSTPGAWRAQAITHYQTARRLLREWDEGGKRDATTYQELAHETQAGILAATIADAGFNETLAIPLPISAQPYPLLPPPTD